MANKIQLLDLDKLKKKSLAELKNLAKNRKIADFETLEKDELILKIID